MNVGIISPVKYLSSCNKDFCLCYASLLWSEPYREYYLEFDGAMLLADSHVLPRRPALDRLREGVKLLKPHYVILPSMDYSADKTITLTGSFLRSTKVRNPIGVLQGYDLDSMLACYTFLKECCDLIALPSPLETVAKREEIARDLKITEQLLWLEVYKDPFEEKPPRDSLGICTSFPFRVAQVNKRLGEYAERPSTPVILDFFSTTIVDELAMENLELYLETLR